MKKILVISNYRGEHIARPEAEIFIGLREIGHEITIMTYPDAAYISRFEKVGIRVIRHHPTKKYDKPFIQFLKKELIAQKYDILHLFNNKAISNGVRAAKGISVTVIAYRSAAANMHWWNPINYLKFFHRRIDYVICNSEEIRTKFLNVPKYDASKAVVIYKGHAVEWYASTKPCDIRAELGLSSDTILLVTVANNRKSKAIPDLISGMKWVDNEHRFVLLIIGNGMDTQEINALVKTSNKQDSIQFLGYREDALAIVASCDAFVLPSSRGESLTKSVIEAMCLGVIPIISDLVGNQPLVEDGVNGLVFRKSDPKHLAEKVNYFLAQPELRSQFSKSSRARIEDKLHVSDTVQQYHSLYNRF